MTDCAPWSMVTEWTRPKKQPSFRLSFPEKTAFILKHHSVVTSHLLFTVDLASGIFCELFSIKNQDLEFGRKYRDIVMNPSTPAKGNDNNDYQRTGFSRKLILDQDIGRKFYHFVQCVLEHVTNEPTTKERPTVDDNRTTSPVHLDEIIMTTLFTATVRQSAASPHFFLSAEQAKICAAGPSVAFNTTRSCRGQ